MNFLKRKTPAEDSPEEDTYVVADAPTKSFRTAILPVIACGAGLFSDGYVNNVSAENPPRTLLLHAVSDQSPGSTGYRFGFDCPHLSVWRPLHDFQC
jgi:hypothetical protein